MSCVIPPVLQNPMLHNEIIANLQNDLDAMAWIDKIYPLAEVGEKEIEQGNRVLVPIVYGQDGDNNYIEMFPDDKLRAHSFFELPNGTYSFDFVNETSSFEFNLIVSANLKRLASREYDFTDELIASCINALKDGYYSNDITAITVTKDKNLVFNKYGYSYEMLKAFMYPNTAFKLTISMNPDINSDCLTTGAFDPSFSPSCP